MERSTREREDEDVHAVRAEPPAREPAVQAGSLAWASAVGNQAVQRLARQSLDEHDEAEEAEAEPEEVTAMTAAGIGPHEAAGLAAVDDLAEDEIPE